MRVVSAFANGRWDQTDARILLASVELGATIAGTARALGISRDTVERRLRKIRVDAAL